LLFHLLNRFVVVDDRLIASQRFDLRLNGTAPLFQVEVTLSREREFPRSVLDLQQVWVLLIKVSWERTLSLLRFLQVHRIQADVRIVQND